MATTSQIGKAETLKREYQRQLDELQRFCTHSQLTPWIGVTYLGGAGSVRAERNCVECGKRIHAKYRCTSCQKELVDGEAKHGDGTQYPIANVYCSHCLTLPPPPICPVYLPSPQIARARGFRKVLGGMPVILTAAISVLGGATLAVGILCLSQSVENLETMRTYVAWPCLTVGTLILLGTAIRSINLDFGPLWDPIPSPNAHSWDTE